MFGAIPYEIFNEIAKSEGAYAQLAFRFPPMININEEYLVSIPVDLDIVATESGLPFKSISSVDHPSFTALRDWLETQGYIKTERNWFNGDRVIDPFYLNGAYFDAGEEFPCACALKVKLKFKKKYY